MKINIYDIDSLGNAKQNQAQVNFKDYQWLSGFDEERKRGEALWPLAVHAAYSIVRKQEEPKVLFTNNKAAIPVPGKEAIPEPFPCDWSEMGTLCNFGNFIGRIIGKPMMADNVYEAMGEEALGNLVDPIHKTIDESHVVSVWDYPSHYHKIIDRYTPK